MGFVLIIGNSSVTLEELSARFMHPIELNEVNHEQRQ